MITSATRGTKSRARKTTIGQRIPPKQVRTEHECRDPGLELYCLQQVALFEPGMSRFQCLSQCCKAIGLRVLDVDDPALLGTALLDWPCRACRIATGRAKTRANVRKPLRRNRDKKAPRAVVFRRNVADNRRCRRGEMLIQRKAY